MKSRLIRFFGVLFFLFLAHHTVVYLHEWTHGFVAWISGYKTSPFHIHYGSEWLTLWDIDESVNYQKIYADGKATVVAVIAIAPVLLQVLLTTLGLRILKSTSVQKNRRLFLITFLMTFFFLAETYAYVPIRTFSQSEDIYNFLTATSLSPWSIAIPGTLFVFWGALSFFKLILPRLFATLKIEKSRSQFCVKLTMLFILLGYYGGVGFIKDDSMSHALSQTSWMILEFWLLTQFLIWLFKLYKRYRSKETI